MKEVLIILALISGAVFIGGVLWEFCSMLEAFSEYIQSITRKNIELAKLYGILRERQILLCYRDELKIKHKQQDTDTNTDETS